MMEGTHERITSNGRVGNMENTKEPLFVLFTVPQQQVGSATCYIAWDGYPTIMRSKGARFHSYADAKAFAKENRIALNGLTYIGLEDLTVVELRGSEAFNYSGPDRGTHHDDDESNGCATSEMETATISNTM
jgi:hypothetical protein